MAMRLLSSRLLASSLPIRACSVTKCASMSTSSDVSKPKEVKKESFRSFLATIFGGKVDPANAKDEPISADEIMFADPTEHATGEGKLYLLAFENGILDPYCNLPAELNGAGSKDNPVKIESFFDERLIGCACEPSQNHFKYTNLYKGEPKRCACGFWLELVQAPKFWEKIPKKDLVTIPYFRDLDNEGKLDKLLSGEIDYRDLPPLQ